MSTRPGDGPRSAVRPCADPHRGHRHLRDLKPGEEVAVIRADQSEVVFAVDRLEQHPKNAFPTKDVYGPTPDATLRLITCGGSFDRSARHYRDNVIAFAHMKP